MNQRRSLYGVLVGLFILVGTVAVMLSAGVFASRGRSGEPDVTATSGLSGAVPAATVSGAVARTTITATLWATDTVQAVVTDVALVCRAPGVLLSPGQSKEGAPAGVVTFTHYLTNTGTVTDVFSLEAKSRQGWALRLLESGHQTRTLQLPLQLGELETADFTVSVTVPIHISDSEVERVVVTATSLTSNVVKSVVTDTVTIQVTRAHTVLLPVIQHHGPLRAKLGVDFGAIVTDADLLEYDLPLAREMGATWVRVPVPWLEIEVSPGQYKWDEYDMVFDRLGQLGFSTMAAVYGAPEWASQESCGPVSDTVMLENFLDLVVARYANVVDVWEFINEPDGREPYPYGPIIGCWGLYPDEYARQLQIFHSKVRAWDPGALIFFGGIAYDNWAHFERSFFEEALQNGAGPFFDGMSFHYYPINSVEFPTIAHKASEIRDTMSRNGVYDKLVWVTETSMWVNTHPVLGGDPEAQRNFIVQEQSRGFCTGIDNIFWFAVREEPWQQPLHRWLISVDHEPDNGYYTYQHFARQIEGLHCMGAYQDVPIGVEAYKFAGSGRLLYVMWSNTVTQTVSIPSPTDAVFSDRDGNGSLVLPARMGEVTVEVGIQPVFVEPTTVH